MSDDIVVRVRTALGANAFSDNTIQMHIADVKDYMLRAGVPKKIIESDAAIGVICRGVADLWNLGSGNVKFSDYFRERVNQLSCSNADDI